MGAAICVLARSNSQDTAQLFKFFADLNLDRRFLPFYRDTNSTGDHSEALSQREIIAGLIAVFDAWIQSESAITVEPLRDLIEVA